MEFGGAKVRLAMRVKVSLKKAFELRLAGDYERAQMAIGEAFDHFVAQERHEVRKAYAESMKYSRKVLKKLGNYVEAQLRGQGARDAGKRLVPTSIDAIMRVDGCRVLETLKANGKDWCPDLVARVERDGILRTAVIVRPGPKLHVRQLVDMLEQEVAHGAAQKSLLCSCRTARIPNLNPGRNSGKLVNGRGMHAKSMVWRPSSGSKELENAFLNAIMTICDPSHCGFRARRTGPFSARPRWNPCPRAERPVRPGSRLMPVAPAPRVPRPRLSRASPAPRPRVPACLALSSHGQRPGRP